MSSSDVISGQMLASFLAQSADFGKDQMGHVDHAESKRSFAVDSELEVVKFLRPDNRWFRRRGREKSVEVRQIPTLPEKVCDRIGGRAALLPRRLGLS